MISRRTVAAATAVLMITLTAGAVPAMAGTTGNEGCSPGFWKNHTDAWWEDDDTLIPTTRNFHSTFGVVMIQKVTLLQALEAKGGPGLLGAEQILSRAATAAYLNAGVDSLGFPLRRAELRAAVQAAWGDRDQMLALATYLDGLNNLGASICS